MNNKGFTLIELAIVMVIVGVVAAGAVKLMSSSINSTKHSSSRNSIEAAIKEIAGYSARAQKLPAESDLGSAVTDTRDAFGTQLYYFPDSALVSPPVSGGVSSLCSVNKTALTVRICADASCSTITNTVSNVAFFLASAGSNENFQFTKNGSVISVYPQNITVDGFASDESTTEANDDLTGYMTLDTLKGFAGCQGFGLSINQDKLPPLAHGNTYYTKITPKGGISPYKWCVESDNDTAQSLTYFTTTPTNINELDSCDKADFVTSDTIELKSSAALNVPNESPSTALVRIRLEDSNGTVVSKQFSVPVVKMHELAMAAKEAEEDTDDSEETEEDVQEEEEDDEIISGSGGFSGFHSTSSYITTATADTVNFHGTSVLNKRWGRRSSMYNQAACVWLNCNIPGQSGNLCPSFTKSKMAVYFEYTPSNFGTFSYFWSTYATAYGFTFAVVKSYRPSWTYNSSTKAVSITGNLSTVTDCGESISGLGYAKRDNSSGNMFGNSFAVEFDRWQTSEDIYDKNDPYKNLSNYGHIAIVSNTSTTVQYNKKKGFGYGHGGFNDNSYSITYGHAYNKHNGNSYSYTKSFSSSYNDACTATANSAGCYLDPDVVSNNTKSSVRIEAVSGCNSSGTVCNGASGNNYVCVYAWKAKSSTLSGDASTAMQDTSKFYKFPGATVPSALPVPLVKDCFPDTPGNYTLDSIRYGFTIGSGNSDQISGTSIPDYSLKLENFKHNILNY